MASNFALVEMQLFFEAVLLLATLVTKLMHLFAHVRYQLTAQAHCCLSVFY